MNKVMSNIKKVQEAVNSKSSSGGVKDDTWWSPPWNDTKKSGSAVIAFLPFKDLFEDEDSGESSPFIPMHVHANMIGTGGKKYWGVMCPSADVEGSQDSCPICSKFFELWNEGDSGKEMARKLSLNRKRKFGGNIVVIKNDMSPDEVGKVFKWNFGVAIQEKIVSKIAPTEDDDEPIFIHSISSPLLFRLKIKEKGGYRNFDDCEWAPQSNKSLADLLWNEAKGANDDEKEAWEDEHIISKLFYVKDFVSPESFKSQEEMQRIVDDVMAAYRGSSAKPQSEAPHSSVQVDSVKAQKQQEQIGDPLGEEDKQTSKNTSEDDDGFDIDSVFGKGE